MPRFSSFTRFGHLRFSKKPSAHELIYSAARSARDGDSATPMFDVSKGTHVEAVLYCEAQAAARAKNLLRRAENQSKPGKCLELLPQQEKDHRIAPPPNASIQQRRDALVARSKLNRGARRESIEDQLTQALGADFLAYRVVNTSEATLWPSNPSLGPGTYSRPDLLPRIVQLLGGNAVIGPSWVSYGNVDLTAPAVLLKVGDVVTVNAGVLDSAERVSVTGTRVSALGVQQFQATFTLFHGYGFIVTTGQFPAQFSTSRFAWIIVSNAASVDPVRRDKVHAVMRRCARGVSQWGIVQKSTATTIGSFNNSTSPLGAVPYGAITI